MKTVLINDVDLYQTYGLFMTNELVIESPEARTNYVEVPGMSGVLDFSTALTGEPVFDNRKISFTLAKVGTTEEIDTARRTVANLFHGRRVKLQFPFIDDEYYFVGRLSVIGLNNYGSGKILFEVDADPFRYKNEETVINEALNATPKEINIEIEGQSLVPSITVTEETTITFNGVNYSLSSGLHKIYSIRLVSGSNVIAASSADGSSIEIKFREASI